MASIRITITTAENMANAMANATIAKDKKLLEAKLAAKVDALLLNLIPESVVELAQKYPDYIYQSNYFRFKSDTDYIRVCASKSFPSKGYEPTYIISNEEMAELEIMKRDISKASESISVFKEKVKQTLLALGTTKRVKEQFPEAIPYLPTEVVKQATCTDIILPIEDITNVLKQYAEQENAINN